jgi:hypothetical protein
MVDRRAAGGQSVGTVDFDIYYKLTNSCWIKWFAWSECAPRTSDISKPQFRPRMGIGQPSGTPCDPITGRPFREAHVSGGVDHRGHCRVLGMRFGDHLPATAVRQAAAMRGSYSIVTGTEDYLHRLDCVLNDLTCRRRTRPSRTTCFPSYSSARPATTAPISRFPGLAHRAMCRRCTFPGSPGTARRFQSGFAAARIIMSARR